MDKKASDAYLQGVVQMCGDIKFEIWRVAGDRKVFFLEGAMLSTALVDSPPDFMGGLKKGDRVTFKGASVFRFDDAGKIVMQNDYYFPA